MSLLEYPHHAEEAAVVPYMEKYLCNKVAREKLHERQMSNKAAAGCDKVREAHELLHCMTR